MTIESTLERIAVALERMSGITALNDPPPTEEAKDVEQPDAPAPKRRGRPPKSQEAAPLPDGAEPFYGAPAAEQEQEVTVEMVRSALVELGKLTSTETGFQIMRTQSGANTISGIKPELRAKVYRATQDAIRLAGKAA